MAPDPEFYRHLLKGYLSGTASREEAAQLIDFIGRHPEEARRIFGDGGELPRAGDAESEVSDRIRTRVMETINAAEAPVYILPVRKKIRVWWAAAAAILILIFSGSYFYFSKPPNRPSESLAAKAVNADIAPGSSKAILTLANGSTIILDSAHTGAIARQGNTNIIKTESGRLAYTASKEKPAETAFNTLATPRGGQFQLMLPDGTKVWLNAASSITYPVAFTGKDRTVTVTGEAYFEVFHDPHHPFSVRTDRIEVQDIGTHFNINAYGDDQTINTTLLEGSVKVVDMRSGKQGRTLQPGEQAVVKTGGDEIEIKRDVDLDKVVAWKNGRMVLTNGTLRQLMSQVSRWYDIDIEYAGPVPDKQFYGSIRRDVPLSTVLHSLKRYGITTSIEGKKIIVH
jgi:transmembrane sensor